MPVNMACPHCQRVGFIRVEHILNGRDQKQAYYCGACDRTWSSAAEPARSCLDTTARRRATRSYGSKRA